MEFVRDGGMCNVKFLDVDVKRPLASVSAICRRGKVCETRIEEVDDVEHEKSEEQRKQDEEEEFGTIPDNRTNKKDLDTK